MNAESLAVTTVNVDESTQPRVSTTNLAVTDASPPYRASESTVPAADRSAVVCHRTVGLLRDAVAGWATARFSYTCEVSSTPGDAPWLPQGFFLRSDYKVSTYRPADIAYLSPAGAPIGISTHMNNYVQQIGTELIYRFNFH